MPRITAPSLAAPASSYWCVPQSMKRGLSGPVARGVMARVARSMTARLYLSPSSSRKTTCFPSGENEPANAFFDPPVNFVSLVFPLPFGLIVTRFADAPGMTKSALVVSRISFPSGDQSCLIATSHEYGVSCRRPVPLGRTTNSACCRCYCLIRTNEISFPSGEKFGSVSQPQSPPRKGLLVTRRFMLPSGRISQTPLLPGAISRS